MRDRLETPKYFGEPTEEIISGAAHDAVEVATTVKITEDVIILANQVQEETPGMDRDQMRAALTAALEELGFEVVK